MQVMQLMQMQRERESLHSERIYCLIEGFCFGVEICRLLLETNVAICCHYLAQMKCIVK